MDDPWRIWSVKEVITTPADISGMCARLSARHVISRLSTFFKASYVSHARAQAQPYLLQA